MRNLHHHRLTSYSFAFHSDPAFALVVVQTVAGPFVGKTEDSVAWVAAAFDRIQLSVGFHAAGDDAVAGGAIVVAASYGTGSSVDCFGIG